MTLTAIDFFCGAGGASLGLISAGAKLLAAVNHSALAVKWHQANHPDVTHITQDMNQMDFTLLPDFDIAWCSVPCTTHSRAKGNYVSPQFDASRATAWAVTTMAEFKRPKYIIVENVVEFKKWELYYPWINILGNLGYCLTSHTLNSKNFGIAQDRERLFLIFEHESNNDFLPCPQFPTETPEISAKEVIKETEAPWTEIYLPNRAKSTLKKIEQGRKRYGREFLIGYYGTNQGRSLDRPIGTIPTKERWAVIKNDFMRMLTTEEIKTFMGFPPSYYLPSNKKDAVFLLGNAVVPAVAEGITKQIIAHHALTRVLG